VSRPPRVLVVDNHDSFTWNLVQALAGLGAAVAVRANDEIDAASCLGGGHDAFVVSPGPGRPEHAGVTPELVRAAGRARRPLLGVCLGHQAIAAACGARIVRAPRAVHGRTSPVLHDGSGPFRGLPSPFPATRYHSLTVDPASVDARELRVTARTPDGVIMGLAHRHLPLWGVQFHPESILTTCGPSLLGNFLACAAAVLPALSNGGK